MMCSAEFFDRSGGVRERIGLLNGPDEAMTQAKAMFATVQVSHSDVVGIRVLDNEGRLVGRWDAWIP
jgi:hypothetical protein